MGCCENAPTAAKRLWQRKWIRMIVLSLSLTAYTFIGGVAFWKIELPNQIKDENDQKAQLQKSLQDYSAKLVAFYQNATIRQNQTILNQTLHNLLTSYAKSVMPDTSDPYRWSLVTGLYYSMTIFTTVGYGNIACTTTVGRVVTIFYALIGIPLALVLLAELGTGLESLLGTIFSSCLRKCCKKSRDERNRCVQAHMFALTLKSTETAGTSVWFVIPIAVIYLFACSLAMSLAQGWSFFDAFYFFMITFTTIGFGDVVPKSPVFALIWSVLLLIGMALIATIISILQTNIQKRYQGPEELPLPDNWHLSSRSDLTSDIFQNRTADSNLDDDEKF